MRSHPTVNSCCPLVPAERVRAAETECTPSDALSCEVDKTCAAGAVGDTCVVADGKIYLANKQETTRLLPTDVQHLVHRRASFILQNRVCSDGSKLLVDPFVVEPSTYGAPPNLNAVQARKGSVALKNIIDVRVSANLQIVSHAVLSMR